MDYRSSTSKAVTSLFKILIQMHPLSINRAILICVLNLLGGVPKVQCRLEKKEIQSMGHSVA